MMPPPSPAVGIGRDEHEWLALVLERFGGDGRRGNREAPEAPLLPGVDEPADGLVIGDR